MKIWIEIDITEDKTTADLTELDTELKVAEKIDKAFNLYKHDYVSVILEAQPPASMEELYEEPTGKGWEEPDDPFESIGYRRIYTNKGK